MKKRYINSNSEELSTWGILPDEQENTEETPAEVESNGPETKNGIVANTQFVNVRKGPSLESGLVEILRKGDKVKILRYVAGFYEVNTSVNKHVYIASDYIEEE